MASSTPRRTEDSGQSETPSLWQAGAQFARLLRLVRPYWPLLFRSIVLGLVAGAVAIAVPYVTKLLIDEVYPSQNVTLMHVLVISLLVLSAATSALGAVRAFFSIYVNARLSNATRLMFFNHLQHLGIRFFDEHQVGEVTSRFQDVARGVDAVARVFETVFAHGVFVLLVPPVLFLLDWRLALLSLFSLPVIVTITVFAARYLRRYWQRSSEAYADLSAYQVEVLSHIRTFKTMGLERNVFVAARERTEKANEAQVRAAGFAQGLGGATGVLRAINTAALAWLGWTLILSGRMTLGDYVAFTAYIGLLYSPMFMLVQLFSDFQQSAVHMNRMFEYLDAEPEQDPVQAYAEPVAPAVAISGGFRFDDVSFGYDPARPVVRGIELELPPGSVTALVGASGSGKTTLLRLLSALEQPDSGAVLVDGRPLAEIPLSEFRHQIAVVWQDHGLVRGTLWENLTLGSLAEPTVDEVDRVVRLCGLEEVVAELPEGYRTQVAEWGASLSAGQRQRVAIARSLLRSTPVLILDEATANIDVETESRILRDIFRHLDGRTLVFVTHRLASAALAEQICVLDRGRIVGRGTHRQLLETCEVYQRLYRASREPSTESRFRAGQKEPRARPSAAGGP